MGATSLCTSILLITANSTGAENGLSLVFSPTLLWSIHQPVTTLIICGKILALNGFHVPHDKSIVNFFPFQVIFAQHNIQMYK